jgi:hypothetical protein
LFSLNRSSLHRVRAHAVETPSVQPARDNCNC